MDDQKIENLLNLALETPEAEREKSLELDVGYNTQERTWDVVIKYQGRLDDLGEDVTITPLMGGYAVITLPQSALSRLAAHPSVEYIEKPKRLYFAVAQGRAASCIQPLQTARFDLRGQGVLVAVIDSGVDYTHPDFRNGDGSSRILFLWDQTGSGIPPRGYNRGREYTKEELDASLRGETGPIPERDDSGHGTAVLGIAAGNGRSSGGRYAGVATESPLIIVKLGVPDPAGFPRTTELMQAVDYAVKKSLELNMPMAINLSFGNVYGSHRGDSLLETYLDNVANVGRTVIVIGTGNEGNTGGHQSGTLVQDQVTEIEFAVGDPETVMNLQLWKNYVDEFQVYIIHPNGRTVGPIGGSRGGGNTAAVGERGGGIASERYLLGGTELLTYYGAPSPYQPTQEIYIDFLPQNTYIDSGIWRLRLVPERIVDGRYDLWMPSAQALNRDTRFLQATVDTTLTIPSTAARGIAVGAYDSHRMAYASFSGRGNTLDTLRIRPDLVAPGVDIDTTAAGGGYAAVTGTSFAAPFVTGSAALLMQWGITEGNDPYLYGEKVKAYLRRGARPLPGFAEFPNPQVGYGALCVRDSLPG